jgi:membrane protease YdiL (CAAX protease family)
VLAACVGVLAFVRLRGRIPFWRDLHRWLASSGVPDAIRRLDATLLLVGATLAAAGCLARGRVATVLGLRGSVAPAARVAAIGAIPMALAGWAAGGGPAPSWELVPGVLVAPFVEELFYRAGLVALPVRAAGLPFWPVVGLSALLFGASHVPWSAELAASDAPVFLVTAAGGAWFAWLFRATGWNLWFPVLVHAAMNLAWMAFQAAPDAAGGWTANAGRAGTIALVTWLAIRERRRLRPS